MATHSPNDLELFHRFLGERLQASGEDLTPEESVAVFRAEQQQLARLEEELRPSMERSERGESTALDIDDIKACGRERLVTKGIFE